ncbi:MAG TPA: HAMP domain-containing sensor histidine kinase [Ktedonobacteraceae bacterium]|nr:HAMP domain-containing sensor histidine kinase [Ktedonobacteraceae bacterium]
MYIPLQLRLTLFYGLLLGLALLVFGNVVYAQAEQRAYSDLDNALSSRAASVQIGKDLLAQQNPARLPMILSDSINGLEGGDIAIQVLDSHLNLLATTTFDTTPDPGLTSVSGFTTSPVPWDKQAARQVLAHPVDSSGNTVAIYTTITYQGQHVRVYTTINPNFGLDHLIQTAQSESAIEQSLNNLRVLLWSGGALVMALALLGGWLLTWGVLATTRRISRTAQAISTSQDFSQRVPEQTRLGKNELTLLASTFNTMLGNLEQVYQQQQRFVADASHELRAPITSIRCNLDLLAKAPDLAPAEVAAALSETRAEADRMGRLVNELLALARADNAKQEARNNDYKKPDGYLNAVDLDSLLLEVFRSYRSAYEQGQEMHIASGPRIVLQDITPAQTRGDADKLRQALVALLDNAVKYTPSEGSVALSLTVEDTRALIRISDTGIGILPEDLPHIFERFYRADRARSRDRGGSGLGLAIARSIVEEHGGSIAAESTPGKGSTFVVRLPLHIQK